jgi:colicin import membrane protein
MQIETVSICFQKEKDSILKIIGLFVIVLHGIFLSFVLYYNTSLPPLKKMNQKLIVNTISLKPLQMTLVSKSDVVKSDMTKIVKEPIKAEVVKEVAPQSEKKQVPVKKVEPVKVETKKKVTPVKKAEPVTKPIVKKQDVKKSTVEKPKPLKDEPKVKPKTEVAKVDEKTEIIKTKQKELLAKAQENLKKIDRGAIASLKNDNINKSSPVVVEQVGSLSIDNLSDSGSINIRELSYKEELANRLKAMLKLPELGEVKIKLTLKNTGAFFKLAILSADSEKNRKYIDREIKNMTFPSFHGMFNSVDEYTFSITLK